MVVRGRRRAHGGAPPPVHVDAREELLSPGHGRGRRRAHGRSSSSQQWRAARGGTKSQGEGAEQCSQRGSRRRKGRAAPARSSATAGAVRRGDEIGQPDGVGVIVGVVLGKNGEMGTTVPRRGYIYPVHWSRLVASTGTKG